MATEKIPNPDSLVKYLGVCAWTVLDISGPCGRGGTGGRIRTTKALDRLEAEDAGTVKVSLK